MEPDGMTVVFDGPSPWRVGRCAACHQPIGFGAHEVVVFADGRGRSYHAKCVREADRGT